jgi:hypothetical protein
MHRWLGVLLLSSGCAFGLTGPDPDRPSTTAPECDTGKGLVVLDSVMAVTAGIVALSLTSESEPVALVPLAIGGLYLGGAIKGNNSVNRCRKAMGEYESYMAARDTEDVPRRVRAPAPEVSAAAATAPAASAAPAPVAPVPGPTPTPAMTTPAAPTAVVSAPAPAPAGPVAPTPVAKPAAKRATPAPAKHDDDDWSDFWKEVE